MPIESKYSQGARFKRYEAEMRDASYSATRKHGNRCWWIDLVYMETICGVAQIIRDPNIAVNDAYDHGQFYYSLPSQFGGFSVDDDVERLQGPSHAERSICRFYDDIVSDI